MTNRVMKQKMERDRRRAKQSPPLPAKETVHKPMMKHEPVGDECRELSTRAGRHKLDGGRTFDVEWRDDGPGVQKGWYRRHEREVHGPFHSSALAWMEGMMQLDGFATREPVKWTSPENWHIQDDPETMKIVGELLGEYHAKALPDPKEVQPPEPEKPEPIPDQVREEPKPEPKQFTATGRGDPKPVPTTAQIDDPDIPACLDRRDEAEREREAASPTNDPDSLFDEIMGGEAT